MPLARAGRARSSSTATAGCRSRCARKRAGRPFTCPAVNRPRSCRARGRKVGFPRACTDSSSGIPKGLAQDDEGSDEFAHAAFAVGGRTRAASRRQHKDHAKVNRCRPHRFPSPFVAGRRQPGSRAPMSETPPDSGIRARASGEHGNLARTSGAYGVSPFSHRCGPGRISRRGGTRPHPMLGRVAALGSPLKTLGKAPVRFVASSPMAKRRCVNDGQRRPVRSAAMSMFKPWRGWPFRPSCLPRRTSLFRKIPSCWDCFPPRALQTRGAVPSAWRSG